MTGHGLRSGLQDHAEGGFQGRLSELVETFSAIAPLQQEGLAAGNRSQAFAQLRDLAREDQRSILLRAGGLLGKMGDDPAYDAARPSGSGANDVVRSGSVERIARRV